MIELELKAINLYDCEFEQFTPDNENYFERWMDLDIGIKGEEGSTIFGLLVASPLWVKEKCENHQIVWRSDLMIIDRFDHEKIRRNIIEIINSCSKKNWELSLASLLRHFSWEYDDYS